MFEKNPRKKNLRNFFRIFLDFLEMIFWYGFSWRNFLGEFFWEEFFGRNSLFTLLKSAKVFEYEWNLCFCQDFGVMEGRKEVEF